eukprot:CAMPEP_0184697716 /NCGR_PEP_ID=MMETSP0313-20130426/4594_1 /TAXON_ID=2792 /ORGANISM="Porphyridium aerugineum, Strain SAG 1380-2" /LENGTH=177 /DNA_ID=CAMNT_0027156549 /DNA_START=110 /DNA_END=643 /DNA_ORIENTATION=-
MELTEKRKAQLSVFILFVSSIIVFAGCADACSSCKGRLAFGIAGGVIATFYSMVMLVLYRFKEDLADMIDLWVSMFSVAWCCAVVGVNTSPSSVQAGILNVYYFSWAMFFASLIWFFYAATQRGFVEASQKGDVTFHFTKEGNTGKAVPADADPVEAAEEGKAPIVVDSTAPPPSTE